MISFVVSGSDFFEEMALKNRFSFLKGLLFRKKWNYRVALMMVSLGQFKWIFTLELIILCAFFMWKYRTKWYRFFLFYLIKNRRAWMNQARRFTVVYMCFKNFCAKKKLLFLYDLSASNYIHAR